MFKLLQQHRAPAAPSEGHWGAKSLWGKCSCPTLDIMRGVWCVWISTKRKSNLNLSANRVSSNCQTKRNVSLKAFREVPLLLILSVVMQDLIAKITDESELYQWHEWSSSRWVLLFECCCLRAVWAACWSVRNSWSTGDGCSRRWVMAASMVCNWCLSQGDRCHSVSRSDLSTHCVRDTLTRTHVLFPSLL